MFTHSNQSHYEYNGVLFARWISMIELYISYIHERAWLHVSFRSTFLYWYGDIQNSIIKIRDSYMDSYIWIIIHHASSAVHKSGFGVQYALIII